MTREQFKHEYRCARIAARNDEPMFYSVAVRCLRDREALPRWADPCYSPVVALLVRRMQ